jgi:hypothetical protein
MTQLTAVVSLVDGTTWDYESVVIISLVEEDGEMKLIEVKDFSDPQKRSGFYAGIAKAAVKGAPAS